MSLLETAASQLAASEASSAASGTQAVAALGAILLLGIIVYIYKQSSATFRKGDRVIVHKAMGNNTFADELPRPGTVTSVNNHFVTVDFGDFALSDGTSVVTVHDTPEYVTKAHGNQVGPLPQPGMQLGTMGSPGSAHSVRSPDQSLPPLRRGSRAPSPGSPGSPEQVVEKKNYGNGVVAYLYSNGTTKEEHPNRSVVYRYANGDVQQVFADERTVYKYEDEGLIVSTWPGGELVREFTAGPATGQKETTYPNGDKMFEFPDGTVKHVDAAGEEHTHFGNGTKLVVTTSGARITTHPNGIVETVGPSGGRMLDYPESPNVGSP